MSATPDQHRQASDPATSAQDLADLAAAHADLRPAIALNPSTYEGLLTWLGQYGDADVQAALATRGRGDSATAPAVPSAIAYGFPDAIPAATTAAARWSEPSRSVPITWLNHDLRYTLALVGVGLACLLRALIVPLALSAAGQAIYYTSESYSGADTLYAVVAFLLSILPSVALGAAVFMLPSRPAHTALALALAGGPLAILFLQLVLSLTGGPWPLHMILAVLGLLFLPAAIAAWLVARMRPGVAFALLPITLLPMAYEFFTSANGGYYWYGLSPLVALFNVLAVGILVGIAWLARLVAQRRATALTPAERAASFEAAQHAARVAHVQQWEAAYAAAHGGEAPPPGTVVPPMVASPAYATGTNLMAILALVFGIGGGVLGIVFGHIALGQIRRTGEQGRGLALAGLICGYLGAGILVIVIIVSIVVTATARSYYYY